MSNAMPVRDIRAYIEDHYDAYPNCDGRTVAEILDELPDQDARYAQGEAGLHDLLLEIPFLP